MLKDAKECIEEEDTVQASEKLYKAAEEAMKSLSEIYAPDLCEEADRRGKMDCKPFVQSGGWGISAWNWKTG